MCRAKVADKELGTVQGLHQFFPKLVLGGHGVSCWGLRATVASRPRSGVGLVKQNGRRGVEVLLQLLQSRAGGVVHIPTAVVHVLEHDGTVGGQLNTGSGRYLPPPGQVFHLQRVGGVRSVHFGVVARMVHGVLLFVDGPNI